MVFDFFGLCSNFTVPTALEGWFKLRFSRPNETRRPVMRHKWGSSNALPDRDLPEGPNERQI
jgi:hypothetical protein